MLNSQNQGKGSDTVRQVSPLDFLNALKWIDGNDLLSVIEPYRRSIFNSALYSFREDGTPQYSMALCGRGKKNFKSCDLVLAALYRFLVWESPQGNDSFILANDQDQAGDDLSLAKKLLDVNPSLSQLVKVYSDRIVRRDGLGSLMILPAKDVSGSHGKTYLFCGFDEIHGYKNGDIFEALSPDPTRPDVMTWITSYSPTVALPKAPLTKFFKAGVEGTDPRMFFSWYSGDFGTDPNFNQLETPEERANPSLKSFHPGYLEQQKLRLATHHYRRLHLNMSGSPEGAFLDADKVEAVIVRDRKRLPPDPKRKYTGFVDMSGGSGDDACLGIAHEEAPDLIQLDYIDKQAGTAPFNPRTAVTKFAAVLKDYGLATVYGDAYAGETFRKDFEDEGITYKKCKLPKTQLYETFEPRVNAGSIELLDHPTLEAQALTLTYRGSQVDHQPGGHDDFVNAAAGAIHFAARPPGSIRVLPWRM